MPTVIHRIRTAVSSVRGAIDLASVMVGVLVIGALAGVIAVAVFGVIPWAQNEAARASIKAVSDAESVARADGGIFLAGDALVYNGWIDDSPEATAGTDETGACFVGIARSDTSTLFYGTSDDPKIDQLNRTTVPGCVDADQLERMVEKVGGWGDIAPVQLEKFAFPDAVQRKPYEATVKFISAGKVDFRVTDGDLPSGLELDETSGTVEGTTGDVGEHSFTITAENAGGKAHHDYSITVRAAAPTITNALLPDGVRGKVYTSAVEFTGDNVFVFESLAKLPPGLTLDSATGVISGSPTIDGTFDFTVTAMNAGGITAQAYTMTVKHSAPSITRSSLPDIMRDEAYSQTLTWVGEAVTFSTSLGTLPAGLRLDAVTGKISGTPTVAGRYDFTITAANSGGISAQAYRITVDLAAPSMAAAYLSGAVVGSDYSARPAWAGKSVTLTAVGLPAGLTIDSGSGVISGSSTAAGTKTFTVTATNFGGSASVGYSIKTLAAKNLASNGSFETANPTPAYADENLALNPNTRPAGAAGAVANSSSVHSVYVEGATGTAPPGLPGLNSGVVSSLKPGQSNSMVLSLYNVDGRGDLPYARKLGAWIFVVGNGYVARAGSTGTPTPVPSATWTYVVASAAESGYNGGAFYAWKKDGSSAGASDYAILTGITSLTGSAPPSAKDLSFSGATASTAEFKYSWSGAANASTSYRMAVQPASTSIGASVVSQSSEWAKSGSKSLRLSSRYATLGSAYADLDLGTPALQTDVMAGKTYTMIATAKTFEARPVAMAIAGVTVTKLNTVESVFSSGSNTVGEQELRVTFTVPANAAQVYLRAYNLGAGSDPDAFFDNVAIVEGIYTGPYIP